MPAKLLVAFLLLSVLQACSKKVEDDEYEDLTLNEKWVLAPKIQDTDATQILNTLLKDYDKKLRPDIGLKPTIIDVDIYVNSIGPVSSINMWINSVMKMRVKLIWTCAGPWRIQNSCYIT
ncbi:gamma-aminobutyric acid receptor subunit gamma-3-like [Protopterus annectens]|uniref:gamma-aminobutyric acid receptor subunit gamma-3-like n=1 Tax=Protopterus annectens TaxID=7888 RepID=UPI001CFB7432|nr:gamma-aminobutyric acid receptor subunit gamma-3-like [Protopterus annectens]